MYIHHNKILPIQSSPSRNPPLPLSLRGTSGPQSSWIPGVSCTATWVGRVAVWWCQHNTPGGSTRPPGNWPVSWAVSLA